MNHNDDLDIGAHKHTWTWWLLAVTAVAWLLWMTLRPNNAVTQDLDPLVRPVLAFGIPSYLLVDLAGNIAVFVPVGAALAMAMKHRSWPIRVLLATLLGAALSLSIELIQTRIPTRIPGVEDWVLNTIGTAAGALIACKVQKSRTRSKAETRHNRPHPM